MKSLILFFLLNFALYSSEGAHRYHHSLNQSQTLMRDVRDLKKSENQKICGKTSSCEECVDLQKYQCMWCGEGEGRCMHYPIKHIWPKTEDCKWTEARWGVCWLDFRALVIALGVIGSILFITFCCCLVRFCTCVKDLIHIICCCGCCNCKLVSEISSSTSYCSFRWRLGSFPKS